MHNFIHHIIKEEVDNFLIEYQEIIDKDGIEQKIRNKESFVIIWVNGRITDQNNFRDLVQYSLGGHIIGGKFDFTNQTIKFIMFDDWGDYKFVLKIQQFLKDLIRLNWIDENWEVIISDKKNTKLTFGGIKLKDILAYDASYTKVIPVCYHGTSDYYLDKIQRLGIVPRKYLGGIGNWTKGYTEKSKHQVYLSIDYMNARGYADNAVDIVNKVYDVNSKPIIVQLKNIPIDNVTIDDDLETNMGMLQLLSVLSTGKVVKNYISGLRSSAQFAYNGTIPTKYINKIIRG